MNAITAITRTTRIAHPTIIRMMLNFSSGIRESMELNLPPSRKQFTIGGGGGRSILVITLPNGLRRDLGERFRAVTMKVTERKRENEGVAEGKRRGRGKTEEGQRENERGAEGKRRRGRG